MSGMTRGRFMLAGLTASLSVATGYLPIAFSFGVAAVQAGLAPSIAVLASVLVYAGASQFLLISLLASGAGLWTALP
ncbi:AzlC family ABC transporter permease, partial [Acinetobacter sp. LH3_13]|uniref:AzlC family ABC transporter permease n=1 Tax=Acinetobacter sp. LH3_13 TaxID=3434463 RepID=UPI003EB9D67A